MLDPSTGRMLRIYPLETVTRWEVSLMFFSFYVFSVTLDDHNNITLVCLLYLTCMVHNQTSFFL